MENKTLVASIATMAIAANLALAGIAGAATSSNDTMTVNMNAGSLALVTPGNLTLEAFNGGGCNGGTISASVSDQPVCAPSGTIEMDDLRSSTSDVTVTVDYGNFTGSTYSQTLSAATMGAIDTDDDEGGGLTWAGETDNTDFDAVTYSSYAWDETQLTPGTPQTIYSFDKPDSTYVLFDAEDSILVYANIPGGTPADTYTNTIAFVIQ